MVLGIIFIVIAYLIGSLSSAILISKMMHLPDPRLEGSGNAGATNVLRISGRLPAALTLLGDLLKGLIPVLIAKICGVSGMLLGFVALAGVVGHMFPVFFQFKGGKGAATAFGGLLVLSFFVAIISIIVWAVVIGITRYVSLASLIAAVLVVVLILFFNTIYFVPAALIAVLIIWRHMDNIERLRAGTETKIDFSNPR
jgi:glycerol-3-phosphate acyltransferase PlsY